MRIIYNSLIALFILFILAALMLMGVKNEEKVTCSKLQQQSTDYEGFFLAQWEKDMCDAHGIEINAEVR